jgi:voltage-gated potassium channel Kch
VYCVGQTDDLQDHIIVCGFGRVGQIIAQLLAERLIPFVVLDVRRLVHFSSVQMYHMELIITVDIMQTFVHSAACTIITLGLEMNVYHVLHEDHVSVSTDSVLCCDLYSERVSVGRALDLPVYFGDAGSREVPLLFLFLQK